ncbi:MAG: sigW [Parcubacteria group bacterium]|nr:sigW [Parcubacteria group bacterium]
MEDSPIPSPSSFAVPSDETLVSRVQAGESDAFGALIERYEGKLLRYGRKFVSDQEDIRDLVQDAFIRAYQNIQSFDTSLRFSPWMYRIAHNVFVNRLKQQKRFPLTYIDFDLFVSHPVYEDPTEREREQEEMRVLIEQFLQELSPKYREVLVLNYLENMAYKDIADVLSVPIGTVGIRLRRAKEALKARYIKHHERYGNT